jgi:HNH endonuclease
MARRLVAGVVQAFAWRLAVHALEEMRHLDRPSLADIYSRPVTTWKGEAQICICACGCGQSFMPPRSSYLRILSGERPGLMRGHKWKREQSPHWKGGVREMDGYRYRYSPDDPRAICGYVAEHRLVVGDLDPREVIHHKDGDRLNNAPENLQRMTRAEHAHHHYVERGGKPLSRVDVEAIRRLQGLHPQTEIARQFGITQIRVSRIFRGTGIYIPDE